MPPKNASKCVVNGCKSKGEICHRFPNPKTDLVRISKWMSIAGLTNIEPVHVYKKKFICALHFTDNCSSPGTKRLNANSIPSLLIPRNSLTIDVVQSACNTPNNAELEIKRSFNNINLKQTL